MIDKILIRINDFKGCWHLGMLLTYRYYYDGTCKYALKLMGKKPIAFKRNCAKHIQYHYDKYKQAASKYGYRVIPVDELDFIYREKFRPLCRKIFK